MWRSGDVPRECAGFGLGEVRAYDEEPEYGVLEEYCCDWEYGEDPWRGDVDGELAIGRVWLRDIWRAWWDPLSGEGRV